jgi:hypothetical protein
VELSEARAEWRGLETKAFLDAACCSIIPQPTKRTLIEFIEMCKICPQELSSGGAPSTRAAPRGIPASAILTTAPPPSRTSSRGSGRPGAPERAQFALKGSCGDTLEGWSMMC